MTRRFQLLGVLFTAMGAGCSSMVLPCFPKERSDLAGEWRFVGRPDDSLPDRLCPPHPAALELRLDGTYAASLSPEQLAKVPDGHGSGACDERYERDAALSPSVVEHVDLFPTAAALPGAPLGTCAAHISGRSLVSMLANGACACGRALGC